MTKRPSVLIIQPDVGARVMLEMMLEGEGLRVAAASSLPSALERLELLGADMIILDESVDGGQADAIERLHAVSAAPVVGLGDFRGSSGLAARFAQPVDNVLLCVRMLWLLNEPQLQRRDLPHPSRRLVSQTG